MHLNIDIKLDNSAYDNLGWELGDNLQDVIERIGLGSKSGTIHDSNGNKTGQWRIDDES